MNTSYEYPASSLYLSITPQQLAALIRNDWRCIEPGRGGQCFYFLKLKQRYAEMIARLSLLPLHGSAYVVRLVLPDRVLAEFPLETIAYENHLEYRVQRHALARLSDELLAPVQLVSTFRDQHSYSVPVGVCPPLQLVS